jgi:ceroid-lipofuscinosis MFS transporter 7
MLIGNLIYVGMETVHLFPKRYLLLATRFVVGMGSGNVAILRTYASTASTMSTRTKALSYVTAGQALGMVLGPSTYLY